MSRKQSQRSEREQVHWDHQLVLEFEPQFDLIVRQHRLQFFLKLANNPLVGIQSIEQALRQTYQAGHWVDRFYLELE